MIKSAVENELKILRLGISKTEKKLAELENKFDMKTDEFYKKFIEGERGDNLEYIRWAGEYETLKYLQRDYSDLEETEFC